MAMELAQRLQQELAVRGWTVTDLAHETDLARGTVARAVRGVGNITVKNAARILAALELEFVITHRLPSWPKATKAARKRLAGVK